MNNLGFGVLKSAFEAQHVPLKALREKENSVLLKILNHLPIVTEEIQSKAKFQHEGLPWLTALASAKLMSILLSLEEAGCRAR